MSELSIEDLLEIVDGICSSVVGLPAVYETSGDKMNINGMAASIVISGAWNGIVIVRTSIKYLNSVATKMFNANPKEVNDEDRADALCELTNMLGGTVKSLLPETCDLALPSIETVQSMGDEVGIKWYAFSCNNERFEIAVIPTSLTHARAA
ncbi:MAG: chemotaxis protein CheX [Granulosicoccus sp.]